MLDIENIRLFGGMDELQVLCDEIDVDQSTGSIFQVPDVVLALLQRDGAAHLGYVVGDD